MQTNRMFDCCFRSILKTNVSRTYDNLVLCAVTLNNKTTKSCSAISQAAKPAIINSFFAKLKCETEKPAKYFATAQVTSEICQIKAKNVSLQV